MSTKKKINSYKLIKAYPNSKPIGTIVKSKSDLNKYPEFWSLITTIPTPKNIKDKITSLPAAIKQLGSKDKDVILYKKMFKAGIDGYPLADVSLTIIAKALNEGWEPDYDDSDQYKYYPYFYWDNIKSAFVCSVTADWHSHASVGARLCFRTRELALHAGQHFSSLYNVFLQKGK